jgi:cellulose synthase/poly-beta-1,6-N-acetylglucosamine synthase-like glycosyltransferase
MVFGVPVIPTVLLNAALSLLRDRSLSVTAPDRLAVFAPMYNEGAAARACLASLLEQSVQPDEIVLSINGGSDDTHAIVVATLAEHGFARDAHRFDTALNATVEAWLREDGGGAPVTVIDRRARASKSDSINEAAAQGILTAERVLVTDGDTVFDRRFVERLRPHFYRLTFVGRGASRRAVIEDVALQSGNVTSFVPPGATAAARFISAARRSEYAFGSVLRRGQVTRLGDGAYFGCSRLFTVVGCGFAVRQDALPLPATTKTEDHDLTLRVQDRPVARTWRRVDGLEAQGFAVVRGGETLRLRDVVDDDVVEFRSGGSARFVEGALMKTQDPPHFDGYIGQVERWHGGAQQNVLGRLGRALRPNVFITMWAAVLENIIGIVLMTALIASVAMNRGNPSLGITPLVLALALAVDMTVSAVLVTLGLYRYHRAHERRWPLLRAVAQSLLGAVPYTLLRYLGPVIYVTSALQVVPEHLLRRRRSASRSVDADAAAGAWERPTRRTRTVSHALLPIGTVGFGVGLMSLASFAPLLNPINDEAWRLTYARDPVRLEAHVGLVILRPPDGLQPPDLGLRGSRSLYCDPTAPGYRGTSAGGTTFGATGEADRYTPLSGWELIALLRLAPLIGFVDSAMLVYGVPGNLFLRVLLNESYLDPLAVGETDDHGLSQQNGDSLTMLRALSRDPTDPLYNPHLFAAPFSVYDPDFSTCAGAAKLAWALRQRDALSDEHAYALYINPIVGVRDGTISDVHVDLVAVMMRLVPLVERLEHTFAAYDRDPTGLARRDRDALRLAADVRAGTVSLEGAYRRAHAQVGRQGLPDASHYQRLLGEMFTAEAPVNR